MKKADLAAQLAGKSKISPGEAADKIDAIMHRIKKKIRRGKGAALPGLGRFKPGQIPRFEFQPEGSDDWPTKKTATGTGPRER